MIFRFASATLVASVLIGLAALGVLLTAFFSPNITLQQFAPVLAAWCLAPLVWGLWAMLTPRAWFPGRLPVWGAILGFVAALLAAFVVNLPSRVAGETVPAAPRGVGVAVLVVVYYLLWHLVRRVYRALAEPMAAK